MLINLNSIIEPQTECEPSPRSRRRHSACAIGKSSQKLHRKKHCSGIQDVFKILIITQNINYNTRSQALLMLNAINSFYGQTISHRVNN